MSTTSTRDYVRLETAADSRDQGYLDCPVCLGKGKLGFLRTSDGIGYRCFRASCSESGFLAAHGAVYRVPAAAPPRASFYNAQDEAATHDELTPEQLDYLQEKFFLNSREMWRLAPRWDAPRHRYVFPLFGKGSEVRGAVHRSYQPGVTPKVLTRPYSATAPLTSWYVRTHGTVSTVMLVEDVISAARASTFCTALALNGTRLSPAALKELEDFEPTRVLICLDRDAAAQAMRLQRELAGRLGSAGWFPLAKDLKNQTRGELEEFMSAVL